MLFSQKALVALCAAGVAGARQYLSVRDADKVLKTIGSLLQRDDKSSVKAFSNIQFLASQVITPGASDSMNSALTSVISEIEQNVDSKLHASFQGIQSEVDAAIDRLDASTNVAVERKTTADTDDDSWFNCVRAEKAMFEGVEQADRDLQSARDSVTEPCQQQEDRTKFDESSLDLPTTFTCDHSESGNCDAQLQNFETQVNSMIEGLTNDVNAKQQLYNEAKAACDAAQADVVAKQSAQEAAVGEFDAKKIECASYHESRQLAFCLFGTSLQGKCQDASMYMDTVSKIEGTANEFSLSELKAEWETSYVVKCMLQKVIEGGSIDDSAVSACEGAVNFEEQVGQIDLKSESYGGLTTPEKFTCSEQTITFRGETWEVGATSSDYVVVSYSPAVTLEPLSPSFAFCLGEAPSVATLVEVLFEESFEGVVADDAEPELCSNGITCRLAAWNNPSHPSYVKLWSNGGGDWKTPFGEQSISVFGYQRCDGGLPCGPITSANAFNEEITAGITYTLTFNVAAYLNYGDFQVELAAVDENGETHSNKWTTTTLAMVQGTAVNKDFSTEGTLTFQAEAGQSYIGQRLAIRLLDRDEGNWGEKPMFDNIRLTRIGA